MTTPDIFLETDSTRFVGPLDITPEDTPGTTRISADPSSGSVTLSDGTLSFGTSTSSLANLSSSGSSVSGDGGALWLEGERPNNDVTITFDDYKQEGQFELSGGSVPDAGVKVYSVDNVSRKTGGVIRIHDVNHGDAIEMKAKRTSGRTAAGRVRVRGSDTRGIVLGGNDAVAELTGGPSTDNTPRGGDLLIRRWPTESEVNGSPEPNDVHVHATADASSDYGRPTNPPRIFFDGPNATVELGRKGIDSFREGEDGRFKLRHGMGGSTNTMLEGGATTPSGSSSDRYPELIFRREDQGTLETTGAIRAESRGLVFYDSGTGSNQNAALIIEKDGTVATRFPIQQAIPKVGPQLTKVNFQVNQGNTAEIPFEAGDDSTINWKLENANGTDLTRGTIDRQGGTDLRMTLTIDTSGGGVTLNGNWTLTVDTPLSNQLPTGQYEVTFEDQYGSAVAQLFVQ